MNFFNSRPLLSRWFAFLVTALLFATLYPLPANPRTTHATGLGVNAKEDYDDPRISHLSPLTDKIKKPSIAQVEKELKYEPDFAEFDRSIIGRVPRDSEGLDNNAPMKRNIRQGQTQFSVFRKNILFGPTSTTSRKPLPFESAPRESPENVTSGDMPDEDRRQDSSQMSRMLYVSLTVCNQPSFKDQSLSKEAQPLLTVYISLSAENQNPGPKQNNFSFETSQGYGSKIISAFGDIYFGVTALENSNFDGDYNYELTASIDTLYAAYNNLTRSPTERENYFMLADSDSTSALFVSSNNLTIDRSPYSIFVYSIDDHTVLGIQQSLCGLQNHVKIKGNLLNGPSTSNVDTRLVGPNQGPRKQQIYVTGLNASTDYFAVLAVDGNSTDDGGRVVRGGGTVGKSVSFRTKSGLLQPLFIQYLISH